jgi:sugar lactone lactonase YvrE
MAERGLLIVIRGCAALSAALFMTVIQGAPVCGASQPTREAIFVTNLGGNYVTVYDLNSDRNAAPLANIRGTLPERALNALVAGASGLDDPFGIAVDPHGQIYVADMSGGANYTGEVLIFAPGSRGSAKPLRQISGADTALLGSRAIAVDSFGNIYVTTKGKPLGHFQSGINVYSVGGSGDLPPSRAIGGPRTGLMNPEGVAVDSKGKLFVANNGVTFGASVLVFAPGSNGDVAPEAVIRGPAGMALSAIALDSRGNVYVIAVKNNTRDFNTLNAIVVYAAADRGYRTIATIAGDRTALATSPGTGIGGIAVDSSGNIYVTWGGGRKGDRVMVYTAGSNGDVFPRSTIEGPHTLLNGPGGIAIGPYPQN